MQRHTSLAKIILRVVLSLILIVVAILLVVFFGTTNSYADNSGTITVFVTNIDNEIVSKKRIPYKKNDTLYELLKSEYNITDSTTSYGHYLTGISSDTFTVNTTGTDSWLWFELAYLDSESSYTDNINLNDYNIQSVNTSIDGIALVNNMIFTINEQDGFHPTSTFSILEENSSSISNKDITNIIKIAVLSLSILIALFFVIYEIVLIILKKDKMTIKELCILVFMTGILFAQEELLTFIPNVQLTVFLLVLYSKKFGFSKTSLILLVHVLLDNLVMGSLNILFTPFMYLAWLVIPLFTTTLLKKCESPLILAISGAVFSFMYCWILLLPTSIVLSIDLGVYLASDIVWEVVLAVSSFVSIILLYEPMSRLLNRLLNPNYEAYQQ